MLSSGFSAASKLFVSSFFIRFVSFITLILVTPIIGPEGFGQLLVVGIILAVFNTVIDIGIENFYILKTNDAKTPLSNSDEIELTDALFSIRLFSNLFLFCLQLAVSYLGKGWLFESPVDIYLRVLSFSYIFTIFGKVNEVKFRRLLQFNTIVKARSIAEVCGSIVKLSLVYGGFGLVGWAIGLMSATFINNLILFLANPVFGKVKPIAKWLRKEILWFSKHSWVIGIGQYFQSQLSNIILKYFFISAEVGYVQFSSSYTVEIYSNLFGSQSQFLAPYFIGRQHEHERIKEALFKMISFTFFILAVPFLFLIFFANSVIELIFGHQWLGAAPLLITYSVYALVRIIYSPCLGILTAIGRLKETVVLSYAHLIAILCILPLVAYHWNDIYIFAIFFVVINVVLELSKSLWGLGFIQLRMMDLIRPQARSLIVVLGTSLFAWVIKMHFGIHNLLELLAAGMAIFVVNILLYALFNPVVFRLVLSKINLSNINFLHAK